MLLMQGLTASPDLAVIFLPSLLTVALSSVVASVMRGGFMENVKG